MLRALQTLARQHISFLRSGVRSAAVGFDAHGEAMGRLAEMLTSHRPQGGGVLTSEGASLSVLTSCQGSVLPSC
jgi:hypothetical protein